MKLSRKVAAGLSAAAIATSLALLPVMSATAALGTTSRTCTEGGGTVTGYVNSSYGSTYVSVQPCNYVNVSIAVRYTYPTSPTTYWTGTTYGQYTVTKNQSNTVQAQHGTSGFTWNS